ncbi:uncharacterized protein LOC144867731 [Branchiostoma floridae x Branchiostoma japonicum]
MAARQDVHKYFFDIKQAVAAEWKDLAFFLVFDEPAISNIEGRNRDDRSRCMDLLQEWKKRNGNAATIGVLMKALYDAGLKDALAGLKRKYPELATYPVTVDQPLQESGRQPPSGQPQQGTTLQPQQREQPASSQDTRQPEQETDESSSYTSRQPQQETAGASSTGEATYASDCPVCPNSPKRVFIVHAGEDKDSLVEPLAQEIVDGQEVPEENVFYDKWSIEPAASIKESISSAIRDGSYRLAVVVVSKDMMKKYWPRREFEEFLKRGRGIKFFPIFYGVTPEEVRNEYSPTLADSCGKEIPRTGGRVDYDTIESTATKIAKILRKL